ncbi:hypothetical protein ACFQI7_11335 [Paenibacillus allorhizosphaerae]|uniref:Uncharacterized protein n=1 Tax=Paenibacillus allorhizosphaerae TaxID=2849866 RepID=A0ABM8VHJ9_9BACL|nr:hypothetical protein [Paenibacillus allorhizosphaerae]CAG7642143.1 hypothetical protein PAECIP111802_02820 [Paenibacillus allorhizosphaerae]
MQSGDGFVIFLIVVLIGAWLYFYIRAQLRRTVGQPAPLDLIEEEDVPEDDATVLLEEEGYRLVSGKKRIPITISVNDDEELHSRLYIDYMVEKDGLYYTVKLASEHKPLDMAGSAIRDRLLVYQLVYPQTSGVLYVDVLEHQIDRFVFVLDKGE